MRSNEEMPEPKVSRRDEHEQHRDDALTVCLVSRSGFRVVAGTRVSVTCIMATGRLPERSSMSEAITSVDLHP